MCILCPRAQEGFEVYEEKEGNDGIDSKNGPEQLFDRDRPAKYGTYTSIYGLDHTISLCFPKTFSVPSIEYDASAPGDYEELVGSEYEHQQHHQIVDSKAEADALGGTYVGACHILQTSTNSVHSQSPVGGIEMTSATSVDFQVRYF